MGSNPGPSRNSSLFTVLRDVKEPTNCSKRVGHGVPGVVVWPCWAYDPSGVCGKALRSNKADGSLHIILPFASNEVFLPVS